MIPFNIPTVLGTEIDYIQEAMNAHLLCGGDKGFSHKCSRWLETNFHCGRVLLTPSCTDALDLAATLLEIIPGDEVIMPSFTFTSTANAFVLRGAKVVFVDIRPDTMNIDEEKIEAAITERTKAIVVVHYAGVACDMDKVLQIANEHGLFVVEDAAQAVDARYGDKYLGTLGDLGCYSFHETKNYTCGEGGALVINNEAFVRRAEILREKGTNRMQFLRGEVDKYTWVDIGSSYLLSELNAAYLYAQLLEHQKIYDARMQIWKAYWNGLQPLRGKGCIDLPFVPNKCNHNAHIFYIKCADLEERTKLMTYLKGQGISAVFHYVPLHSSLAGRQYGRFNGTDVYTTAESERLLRLPIHTSLSLQDVSLVVQAIARFYGARLGETA